MRARGESASLGEHAPLGRPSAPYAPCPLAPRADDCTSQVTGGACSSLTPLTLRNAALRSHLEVAPSHDGRRRSPPVGGGVGAAGQFFFSSF